jgi:hypothetical protein
MTRQNRYPQELQVLRLPHGLVASAGASATRCPAHLAAASAPHRAGGSTYVRSVTLQRRTWRGAVERRPGGHRAGPLRARCHVARAELYASTGKSDAAPAELAVANELFAALVMTSWKREATRWRCGSPHREDGHWHVSQTLLRNYPGSCSQRGPKRAKADGVRSAYLRRVVCGALAPNPAPATKDDGGVSGRRSR